MSLRVFFVDEQDRIERIPVKTYEEWRRDSLALPEYSSQKIRIAVFYGEAECRRLSKILHASFSRETVEADGTFKFNPSAIFECLNGKRKLLSAPKYTQTLGVQIECHDWVPSQEQVDEFYLQMFSKRRMQSATREESFIPRTQQLRDANIANVGAY